MGFAKPRRRAFGITAWWRPSKPGKAAKTKAATENRGAFAILAAPGALKLALDAVPLVVLAVAGLALIGPKPRPWRGGERASGTGAGGFLQAGRGRYARAPHQIPARGWKDILKRTWSEFNEDHIPLIAAGMTFYALLAIFPGLAALVSIYGLFTDIHHMHEHINALARVLPGGALQIIGEQMQRLEATPSSGLSIGFVTGLLISIWSANGAMKSLMIGLDIAYEEEETRSFFRRVLISLGFTLGFLVLAIGVIAVPSLAAAADRLTGPPAGLIVNLISWPVLLALLMIGLALVYRYGPSRDPVKFRWISWGAAAVIVAWLAMSALFSLYVANFGHFNKTYGSLGAAAGFMTWLYLSNMVVLLGAELNAEIEHQTAVDTTQGKPAPLGLRGAKMADTLGAAQA